MPSNDIFRAAPAEQKDYPEPAPVECACGGLISPRFHRIAFVGIDVGWHFPSCCEDCIKRTQDEHRKERESFEIQQIIGQCGTNELHEKMTLANLETSPEIMQKLEECVDGCSNLFLWGSTGCGKTHAAIGTMKAAILVCQNRRGVAVLTRHERPVFGNG